MDVAVSWGSVREISHQIQGACTDMAFGQSFETAQPKLNLSQCRFIAKAAASLGVVQAALWQLLSVLLPRGTPSQKLELGGYSPGTLCDDKALSSLDSEGIARHFRFGNQEDAHEFLQYTVDAMQKACLNGSNK